MQRPLLAFALAAAGCAARGPKASLCARLEGAGPGSDALDPQHKGVAVLELEPTAIRYRIEAAGLRKVIAVHIHHGEPGENGPMLWEINPGYIGDSVRGVATDVPPGVIALLAKYPSEFYVKLHSVSYPGGAIRGQLEPCGKGVQSLQFH